MRAHLVRVASEAGAGAVAVANAADDPTARERFGDAIARGDLATWPYDAAYAARSTSPQSLLPGARSVVCVAIPYASEAPKQRAPLTGRVSTYAWGEDYHRHVRAVLERIAAELDAMAGEPATRIVCDTAPFAERAFAERAGLGWVGKHANLIAPGAGSFVFLGEIVTTLDIAPDAPSKKSCGSCTRCVDVCPTQALRGDYTMDSTRCIADLTQRTDGIPREMRALVGDWIWGCDLCQEVCPPTRRAARAPATVEPEAAYPDLVALLSLRSGAYKRQYRSRAIGWRGAAVLRRNAAVALGNALDRSAVPALKKALVQDPHPMVRGHVAWALGRIGSPSARSALRSAQA
ncbi:MAG: tRNA epoxyqueuosine(34) reductase QueG, partial [Candidatus Eremiobacteraeota bacterium]|nr:tRNA epoxyqueuosine(34) reductase QueG [Candidatus Eremiobacteraeota bacterium]